MLIGFPAAGFPSGSSHVRSLIAEQWGPATLPVWGASDGLMETTVHFSSPQPTLLPLW